MNHKQYEDWLFNYQEQSEFGFSSEQGTLFHEHLSECGSCRLLEEAWSQVEATLKGSSTVGPKPGFSARWRSHIHHEQQRAYRRQTITVLSASAIGVITIIGLLLFLIWPWLRSPNVLIWAWIYRLFTMYTIIESGNLFVSILSQFASGFNSLGWWMLFAGVLSELGVLWIVSFRYLTNPRRISK